MPTGSPAPRTLAYTAVFEQLRDRILAGDLTPGERLPAEVDLGVEFGVGRSTIREALRALTSQHLIVTTRGVTGGSFVALPEADDICANLETGVALLTAGKTVTVDQLMQVRHFLEVPAAGRAAEGADPHLVDELSGALYDPSTTAGPDTFTHNQRFHLLLLEAVGNPVVQLIAVPMFNVLGTRFGRDRAPNGFWRTVDADHRHLLQAVAAGDPEAARRLMAEHLDHLGEAYRRMDRRRNR